MAHSRINVFLLLQQLWAVTYSKDEVATAVGMAGACAWSGQLIFNLFIGAFVHIIGFAPFFIATAFFDIIGAIALWMLIKVKDEEPQVQLATS